MFGVGGGWSREEMGHVHGFGRAADDAAIPGVRIRGSLPREMPLLRSVARAMGA